MNGDGLCTLWATWSTFFGAVSFDFRTFSLLGEKGEAGAISRPLGALPLSAVGEAGERIFGEDGAGSHHCRAHWVREIVREIVGESLRRSRSSAPTCRVQASVPWSRGTRRRQPALRPEQSRGPFPSRPEPGRQRPGVLHSSLRLTASSYRLHGCPLHCRSSAHAGQQGARHQFG